MQRERHTRWGALVPAALLIISSLACGGFQVRVTPTPAPPTEEPIAAPVATEPAPTATTASAPALSPTPAPSATPVTPVGMTVGAKARVAATGGINVRDKASTKGKVVGRLNVKATVTLLEGPVTADNYEWWRVDNGAGIVGWAAAGPANDPWLLPVTTGAAPDATPGGPKLVNRPVQLGDHVQVTTTIGQQLTVRDSAGKDGTKIANVLRGTRYTVRGGPVKQDNLTWWELEGETLKGWAAEGDGTDRWLTPIE